MLQSKLLVGKKMKMVDSWVEVVNTIEKIIMIVAAMAMERHETSSNA